MELPYIRGKMYFSIFLILVITFLYLSSKNNVIEGFQNKDAQSISDLNVIGPTLKYFLENGVNLIRKIDNIERTLKENSKFIEKAKKEYEERRRNEVILNKVGLDKGIQMANMQKDTLLKDTGMSDEEFRRTVNNP